MDNIKTYIYNNTISLSILLNTILGGEKYQTFSARNYEWKLNNQLNIVWLIDKCVWFEKNHCMACWASWTLRHTALKVNKKTTK